MIEKTTESSIIEHLLSLADQLKKQGSQHGAGHELSAQQLTILQYLAKDPNMPFFNNKKNGQYVFATDLAQSLMVTRANITNHLNSLQQKELIEQQSHQPDGRKKKLELTEKGEQTVGILQKEVRSSNVKIFATFTHSEKEQFLDYLRRCLGE